MHRKNTKHKEKPTTKKTKAHKSKANPKNDGKKLEKKQSEKLLSKNEATASTMISRSDPDRFLRTKRIRNTKTKQNANLRYISEYSGNPFEAKINLDLKMKIPLLQLDENEGGISFREYMIIADKWYPVLNSSQRSRLMNFPMPSLQQKLKLPLQKLDKQVQSENGEKTISEQLRGLSKKLIRERDILSDEKNFDRQKFCGYIQRILNQLSQRQKSQPPPSKKQKISQKPFREEEEQQVNSVHSPIKLLENSEDNQINGEKVNERTNSLVQIITFRQFSQLGYAICTDFSQGVQTDVLSIGSFIEIVYEQLASSNLLKQVLQNLSLAYGFQKFKKYHKISHRQELANPCFQVIPDQLFETLIRKLLGSPTQFSRFQLTHTKAIFDLINDELLRLKPYYDSLGQNFAWNFKLSVPITFYDIDSDSLGIAFSQIKDKILTKASMLCGLIVDHSQNLNKEEQIELCALLDDRRKARQNKMCEKHLKNPRWKMIEDNQTQFESIRILNQISQNIFKQLMDEFSVSFDL